MNKNQDKITAPSQGQKELKGSTSWSIKQIKAARNVWGKLSEHEIIKSAGNRKKLSILVEKQYLITHDAAHKQVDNFFTEHHI